jgi:hypothetical protein
VNAPASVQRLANNAAALVRAAAPGEWPRGFVVVPDRLPPRINGLACGDGAAVAQVYRLRPGVCAVLVDVWKLAADLEAPTPIEWARVERAALHEAAHTLVASPTRYAVEAVDAALMDAGTTVMEYPAHTVAAQHCPRWAMAFWLLAHRAAEYRPRWGDMLCRHVRLELQAYGYPAADLERLAAGVAPDAPLAAQLVSGGLWDTLLAARLPDDETRAAAIVAAGVPCGGQKEG